MTTEADKWADVYRSLTILNGGRMDCDAALTGLVLFAVDALRDNPERADALTGLIGVLRGLADKVNESV